MYSNITFIIPTIGRSTLLKTIESLKNQTNNLWKAIIIFDGIDSTIENNDDRITILKSEKLGINTNKAANVRNYGIKFATTEWVAFLDDDDSISNDYIDKFLNEITLFNQVEILVFRMLNNDGRILPELDSSKLEFHHVGISFAVKKSLFDSGLIFHPSHCEDFIYLYNCVKNGCKLIISPYITYFVREYENNKNDSLGTRVFFNYII